MTNDGGRAAYTLLAVENILENLDDQIRECQAGLWFVHDSLFEMAAIREPFDAPGYEDQRESVMGFAIYDSFGKTHEFCLSREDAVRVMKQRLTCALRVIIEKKLDEEYQLGAMPRYCVVARLAHTSTWFLVATASDYDVAEDIAAAHRKNGIGGGAWNSRTNAFCAPTYRSDNACYAVAIEKHSLRAFNISPADIEE